MQRSLVVLALVVVAGCHAVLAFVVFPGAGFASDLAAFQGWAKVVATYGPAGFYEHDPSANYPPVSIYALWGVEALSRLVAGVTARPSAEVLVLLLKVPAVLADLLTAAVVWSSARRWRGPDVAVVATFAFLLVPPVWYVSAVWGQLDSVLGLFSILALWLAVRGRWHLAALAAVGAVMVKPQGVLVVLVVGVVLVASLARRDSSGERHLLRLTSTLVVAAAAALALLVPFDYEHLAPPEVATLPVVGDVVGFWRQSVETGGLFPVLTANADNVWALVGDPSLATSFATGTAVWHVDSTRVLGQPAWLVGIIAFGVVAAGVVAGLLVRRDLVGVLLGYTVLSYAFFVLPTRVHERYLIPVFATAAVLAAPHVLRLVAFLAAGVLQLVNLHAVLAAPLDVLVVRTSVPRPVPRVRPAMDPPPADRPHDVVLPWAGGARAEWVVQLVSVGQLAVLLGLLVTWVLVVRRSPQPSAPA